MQSWPPWRLVSQGITPRGGFTLIEIVMVVSLVAVVSSIGVPAADSFMASQRAGAEAKTFLADVRYARYEAMRTQQYHRLVLSELASQNTYKVEVFIEPTENVITQAMVADPAKWLSTLDSDKRALSADVSVTLGNPGTIYFSPQGTLLENWVPGGYDLAILSRNVGFNYGNATATITLSGFGGLSSDEYYEEQ